MIPHKKGTPRNSIREHERPHLQCCIQPNGPETEGSVKGVQGDMRL